MGYPSDMTGSRPPLPGPLRGARVLLFVFTGFTLVTVAAGLAVGGLEGSSAAESAGMAAWLAVPGILTLVCGLRMGKGRRPLLWGTGALMVFLLLLALANLGQGDPRGLVQMILPATVLVLILLPRSRAHLA